MRVFVTGATGFVGEEIVRQLHAAGHSIRILARNPGSRQVRQTVSKWNVEVHPGDVQSSEALERGLNGIDAVIHLVGIISEVGGSTYENIHTRGTQHMAAAAQKAGVSRFIQMSALGTRPNAIARYHQSKWAAEEIVRNSALRATIFRPSLIFGPHDHFVNLFAKISRFSPIVPVIGAPNAKFQPVSVETVGAAFVKSLGNPNAIGQTYDLCGPNTLTMSEMLDDILAVLKRRRLKVPVPTWLARAQASLLEVVFPNLFGKAPPLNRDQLIMLGEDNIGDAKKAEEAFGLRPIPFREGIAKYL